jgi:DNA-binding LytR/AlgR family response regulator
VTDGLGGLRALAVDDEPPALADLLWQLHHDDRIREVRAVDSASEALRALESETFDVVFLDVRMPGLDGLDVARLLARFERRPTIVFVTAYEHFAVDAFELAAVDYLLKPVESARLSEAIGRVCAARSERVEERPAEDDVVVPVELGGVTTFVRRSDVLWVEAHGDYVRLHTSDAHHLVRVPLRTLEQDWADAGFVRIHRSLLVSLRHVEELRVDSGRTTVRLGGAVLSVSRRHARDVRHLLGMRAPGSWR